MTTKINLKNLLAFVFLFDCVVLPVIKIANLSYKTSYMIAFVGVGWLVLSLVVGLKKEDWRVNRTVLLLFCYLFALFFAEFYASLRFGIEFTTLFYKIVIGGVLMIGSLYYGYICQADIGKSAFWCLVCNVVVNCVLALFGHSAPGFMVRLYSISLDTFMDGYYRNGGIIGNPNSSLLITNMILLAVVLLYKYDKLKMNNIMIAAVYLLPLAADIIVSSRGELLHTVLILAYFTFVLVKKNKNVLRLLWKILCIVLIVFVVLSLTATYFLNRFPNIQTSLDRMTTLETLFDTSRSDSDISSIARPIYRFETFWERYQNSPILGTGVESNRNLDAFEKDTTGYHNDIFLLLASAGIVGLLVWVIIVADATRTIGICMLSPFVISALSNTFIRSYAATMVYFFLIGYFYRVFRPTQVETPKKKLYIDRI